MTENIRKISCEHNVGYYEMKQHRPLFDEECSWVLRCVHITRARAGVRQACARWETRLAFTCAHKSSSTLLQLLARLRRERIRIFTRSVYRL
jgi:hypothetical protein